MAPKVEITDGLDKLQRLADEGGLHAINVNRRAGVGLTFYEGPQELLDPEYMYQKDESQPLGFKTREEWKQHLVTHMYYRTVREAVEAEYARVFGADA